MLPTRYLTSVTFRGEIRKNCVARSSVTAEDPRNPRNIFRKEDALENERDAPFISCFSNARPFEVREKHCYTVARLNRSLHLTARRSSRPLNVPFSGLTFAALYETCSTLRLISSIIIGDISDIKDKFYGPGPRTGTDAFAF